MITSIHGILEATGVDSAIIRVGGFGIRVFAPSTTLNRLSEVGMEVSLATHFHMREDGHVQPQGIAIQQGDAPFDHAVLLELLDAAPAGRRGELGPRRHFRNRQGALPL